MDGLLRNREDSILNDQVAGYTRNKKKKRRSKIPVPELDWKEIRDEATSHFKSQEYQKALQHYNTASIQFSRMDSGDVMKENLANIDKQVKHILQITRQDEVIRSFVRSHISGSEDELQDRGKKITTFRIDSSEILDKHTENANVVRRKSSSATAAYPPLGKEYNLDQLGEKKKTKRSRRQRLLEEVYTDKDRAAAVNLGSRDIKQSLRLKRRQDKSKILEISEEAHPGTLLALGNHELRNKDVKIAIHFINKALELNPYDKNALVARSKCYLLLGEAKLALEDAEKALDQDKKFIKGIYEKAEALYHLGKFEYSLMYFHRGLHLRPEMEDFRLGVQKAQQAIQNTIGKAGLWLKLPRTQNALEMKSYNKILSNNASSCAKRTYQSRNLLKELYVDKEYLENLLQNPDIHSVNRKSEKIQSEVEDGVQFLKTRQEFWRQQQPLKLNKRNRQNKK